MASERDLDRIESKVEEHDTAIGKIFTKISVIENEESHFSQNCLLIQEHFNNKIEAQSEKFTRQVEQLEKKIENGFNDTIKNAVVAAIQESMPNQIVNKKGLEISDKVTIAIIQLIGIIISSYIGYRAAIYSNVFLPVLFSILF